MSRLNFKIIYLSSYDVSPYPFHNLLTPTPTSTPLSHPLITSSDITTTCSTPTPETPPTPILNPSVLDISLIVDLSQPLPIYNLEDPLDLTIQPSHLTNFICTTAHWCNVVTFDSLPSSNQAVLLSQSQRVEPTSYKKVVLDPLWVQAMNSELKAL